MEELLKQLIVGQNKLVESVGNIEKKLVEHDEQFEAIRTDVKLININISEIKEEQKEMHENVSQIKAIIGYIWGDIGKLDQRVSKHDIQLAK